MHSYLISRLEIGCEVYSTFISVIYIRDDGCLTKFIDFLNPFSYFCCNNMRNMKEKLSDLFVEIKIHTFFFTFSPFSAIFDKRKYLLKISYDYAFYTL